MTSISYAEYKDSKSEWMGEIPSDWREEPLKYAVTLVNGAVFKPDSWSESGVPIVRIENLNGGDNFNYCDHFVLPRHHIRKGDLVFAWSGNRGTSFGPFVWDREGLYYLNQHIFKVVDHDFDDKWLYWTLKALTHHVEEKAHGIIGMVHITKGELGDIRIPKIEKNEQSAIANFLDRETAKIDTLIDKQEQLIKLLEEKRQAVISHAVTKGLNPDVRMKDSGVEWLGEIPEHWDASLLKYYTKRITDGAHISPETEGGVHYFVSTRDLMDDRIAFDGALLTSAESYHYLVRTGCKPKDGDVLFSKDGTVGKTVVVEGGIDFVVASSLIIIRANHAICDPNYLNYLCRSEVVSEQVASFVKGAALKRLSIQNLLKIFGVFPPLNEQRSIAEFIQSSEGAILSIVAKSRAMIRLLSERRTALTSATVTGKIDVRDAL